MKTIAFWKILAIGVVLICVRFYPAALDGKVTVFGDNYSLQVPGKIFTSYWLKQGIIPWWNPTIFAGIPWTQEISQSVFYPTTLLFMFLNPGTALNLSIALHLLFTYLGMYLLGKTWTRNDFSALVASVLWTFSTQVTGSSNNLVTIQSISWFPWVSYWGLQLFAYNKNILIFALFILGQFLAGYPQHVVYAIFLAVFLSAIYYFKKISFLSWFRRWVVTGIVTVFASAVAWIPFLEVFLQSTRIIQTNEQAAVGSLNLLMLVKLIIPYFFDNPAAGIKWGPAWSGFPNSLFYITWVGLIALVGSIQKGTLRAKSLIFFIVFALFFSLGSGLPGFNYIQDLIPFFKFGRYPSMILVPANIALVLLAAQSLNRSVSGRILYRHVALFGGMVVLVVVGKYALTDYFDWLWSTANQLLNNKLLNSSFHTLEKDYVIAQNILNNVLFNLIFFVGALYFFKAQKLNIAVLIIGLDMIYNTQGMLFFGPNSSYPSWQQIYSSIRSANILRDPQKRILTRNMNQPYTDFGMYWEAMTVRKPFSDSFVDQKELMSAYYLQQMRDSYTPDWNMVYQIPIIHGYTTLLPKDYAALWEIDMSPGINAIDKIDIQSNLLKQWAAGNYIVDKQFEIKEVLPQSTPFALSSTLDLYTLPALPRFRFEDDSPMNISSLRETPNKLSLSINNDEHTSAIIADRFDTNWKLTINGHEQRIENYQGMRKFPLSPGDNFIEMEYVPKWFLAGFVITTATVAISVLMILKKSRDDKQRVPFFARIN